MSTRRLHPLLVALLALTAGCGFGPAGPATDATGIDSPAGNETRTVTATTSVGVDAGEFAYGPGWSREGATDPAGVVADAQSLFASGRYRASMAATVENLNESDDDGRIRLRSVLVRGAEARYERAGIGDADDDGERAFGGASYVGDTGPLAGVVFSRTTFLGVTGGDSMNGQAAIDATDEEADPEPTSTAVLYAAVGSYRSASVVEHGGTAMVQYRVAGVNATAAERFDAERFDLASTALLGFAESDRETFAPERVRGTVTVDGQGRVRRVNLSVVRTLSGRDGNVTVEMGLRYRLTEVGTATAPRPDWVDETPVVRAARVDDPAYDHPVIAIEHVAGPPVRPDAEDDGLLVRILPRGTDGEVYFADYYDTSVRLPAGTTLDSDTTLYVYGSGTAEQATVSVDERPDPDAVAPMEFAFRVRGPAVVAVDPGDAGVGYYAAVDSGTDG